MSSESASADSLLGQFRNVSDVFDDYVVAKPTGAVFHRIRPDAERPRPACRADQNRDEWHAVETENAQEVGLDPCRTCYESILEYLAHHSSSPVEPRTSKFELTPDQVADDFELVQPNPQPTPLTSLTDSVLVTGGSSMVMHAPTANGTYCGKSGDYRTVERELVVSHYRPCKRCFDIADE